MPSYLGQTITFQQQETTEISSLGVVLQIQTGVGIKLLTPAAKAPPVQHGDLSDAELCVWIMGP